MDDRGPEPQDSPADGVECASPPCLLRELDPSFGGTAARGEVTARRPVATALQDWEEVRLWRKVKRAVLLERRQAVPAALRAAHGEAITASLLRRLLPCRPGTLLGFYWPFKGEYDPRPLARRLRAEGVRLALPVVIEKRQPLIFREWWPGIAMTHGVWNIPIPATGAAVVPDVLLAPLVGFDDRRFRLGYGGGYYDRTLAALPVKPCVIGVGFALSRIPTIYPQPHDVAMDAIVTEGGIEES